MITLAKRKKVTKEKDKMKMEYPMEGNTQKNIIKCLKVTKLLACGIISLAINYLGRTLECIKNVEVKEYT